MYVRALRGFADGCISILLPVYLHALGMAPVEIGVIATATLAGSGAMVLWTGMRATHFQARTLLLAASLLMAATGFGFALAPGFWPLLLVAVVGTLNPSSGDVSVFLPIEHALLTQSGQARERTALFARYSLTGTLSAAAGALAAGAPAFISTATGMASVTALQCMFVLYGAAGLAAVAIYRGLPARPRAAAKAAPSPLRQSRRHVYTLAALFSLDAFGGGLLVQSLLALWLFQQFQLSVAAAGTIFACCGLLAALSYLAAVRLADRFGLINTMVFTHLPSSLLLIAIPFAPSLTVAVLLLFVRSALSQMDVPTRSSYVMAIVPPEERAAAASITSVPRSLAAAASPVLAGYLLGISPFGWPLVMAGGLKITYDVLLYVLFKDVRPPEEGVGKQT
ncbi:MFS transporter [Duganella ginsengisoli]|uniref:MFS transporter n=1 Tax=Pseudoduganella ginsengisoli TaxID=1462440 RepID=A0A6L6Q4V3_9BURK|nr:MFS transporter [Pseudoduganella ginsengisoli]